MCAAEKESLCCFPGITTPSNNLYGALLPKICPRTAIYRERA
jgi:hypothetical protein